MPGHRPQTWYFFFTLCGKIPLKVYLQVSICLKRSMYFLFLIYIIHWPLLSLQENFPMVLYLYICNRQLGTGWFSKNTCGFFFTGWLFSLNCRCTPGNFSRSYTIFNRTEFLIWYPENVRNPRKLKIIYKHASSLNASIWYQASLVSQNSFATGHVLVIVKHTCVPAYAPVDQSFTRTMAFQ